MKFDFHGIKFNIWLYFLLFALAILFVLGGLQMAFIRPYYRNSKINAVKEVAQTLQQMLLEENQIDNRDLHDALQVSVNNNVCTVIFNDAGQKIYSSDSLGASCLLNQSIVLNEQESIVPNESGERMKTYLMSFDGEFSEVVTNERSSQEMVLYGKYIAGNLSNFYLFVNSPLEPVDSILIFFQEQYVFYTVMILGFSVIVSTLLSMHISKPILKMKQTADELAVGHYDLRFEDAYFTELNDLSQTLSEAGEKLGKIDELRKDLMANISHDIKTPLTMIKAYAEMIRDISGDNPTKRNEHLEVIMDEVDYLDRLVYDMQELSKVQSGTYELRKENFDLVESIHHILRLTSGMIQDKHIHVELECPQEYIVYADDIKINQVLYNIISNALKHSLDCGMLRVKVERIEDGCRVEIEDNGEGIAADKLPYIWDRYYKIDKSFGRNEQGTGLGLSIVKAVLESHHARYGVESEEGKGTLFWFELMDEDDV